MRFGNLFLNDVQRRKIIAVVIGRKYTDYLGGIDYDDSFVYIDMAKIEVDRASAKLLVQYLENQLGSRLTDPPPNPPSGPSA